MDLAHRFANVRVVVEGVRVGYLSTFPPTECGIATFTQDLVNAVDRTTLISRSEVLAIGHHGQSPQYDDRRVRFRINQQSLADYHEAAEYLNQSQVRVVCVEHEFGIFGGELGSYVLPFMQALRRPVVLTLHTLLPDPEPQMRRATQEVVSRADRIVVMNTAAAQVLADQYGVGPDRIRHIHHGVPEFAGRSPERVKRELGLSGRTVVATFGLISRGKGLEYAIEAMPAIARSHPDALYLILGQTHPGVQRREGESYREHLESLIERLGVRDHVRFVNRYLTKREITDYLLAADICVTPYLNPHQLVSGVLAYAVGAGKPIISTPYWYALDLLAHGRGMIVDFRDPAGIADAADCLLDSPQLRCALAGRTRRLGKGMRWSRVALEYVALFQEAARLPERAWVRKRVAPVAPLVAGLGRKREV